MNHIDSIQLKGMDSHSNTFIEFSPGVNVIIGETDAGKSAIMRGFRWVRYNRPSGDDHLRHGSKGQFVTVSGGGTGITRGKTKSKNYYQLTDGAGKDCGTYKNVGSNVPEDIAARMPLQAINFLRQRDPIFFLTMNGGERVRFLNDQVSDLWLIDKFTADYNREIRSFEKAENDAKQAAEEAEQKTQDLEWVPDKQETIKELSAQNRTLEEQCTKCDRTGDNLESAQALKSAIPDRDFIAGKSKEVSELSETAGTLETARDKMLSTASMHMRAARMEAALEQCPRLTDDIADRIKTLIAQAEKYNQASETLSKTADTVKRAQEKAEAVEQCPRLTTKLSRRITRLVNKADTLNGQNGEFHSVYDCLEKAETKVQVLDKRRKAIEELRNTFNEEFPEVCPLCGSTVG